MCGLPDWPAKDFGVLLTAPEALLVDGQDLETQQTTINGSSTAGKTRWRTRLIDSEKGQSETYMSEKRLLPQGSDQPLGVHLSQPQDVERTAVYTHKHTQDIRDRMGFDNTFTLHLADALIQSDLQCVQGHSPEASRVKCLAQEHNVNLRSRGIEPATF